MKKKKPQQPHVCPLCGAPLVLLECHDHLWRAAPGTGYGSYALTCECWFCIGCNRKGRENEPRCGCWLCRCCEHYGEIGKLLNPAGKPCCMCAHEQGACDCVECPRRCGYLHPVGYVCTVMKKRSRRKKTVVTLRPYTAMIPWQSLTPDERRRLLDRGKLTADDLAALKALGLDDDSEIPF